MPTASSGAGERGSAAPRGMNCECAGLLMGRRISPAEAERYLYQLDSEPKRRLTVLGV
ncbi:MAG: hypothetical protein V3T72_02180 [Thermoanaerobaculia bacterium]